MAEFFIWPFIWLGLYFLPRILLTGVHWQSQAQFLAAHPDKERVFSGYKLFLILWLPLSLVVTARFFQDVPIRVFYLFLAFVPLLGVGLVKSVLEITLGIGWFYGFRMPEKPTGRIPFVNHSLRFLQIYVFHFVLVEKRVRPVGMIRLVLNTAVLITLAIIAIRYF